MVGVQAALAAGLRVYWYQPDVIETRGVGLARCEFSVRCRRYRTCSRKTCRTTLIGVDP